VAWPTKGVHGTQTVTAYADPGNLVRESDESNNSASVSVRVPG